MTVGSAGNNTNVSPQNYGGVPPKPEQGAEFKAALNDATTSTGASPSSKGTEPSQDTSKSFPIILANRPPINLGNQVGPQGAPSQAGTTTAPAAAPTSAPAPATKTVPGTSTPVPQDAVVDNRTKEATVQSGDLTVKVKPDRKAGNGQDAKEKVEPDGAVTHGDIKVNTHWTKQNGKITSVTVKKELEVQTTYGSKADPAGGSAYGRGSLKADKDAGNGTLRFHEGNHGQDFIEYARTHPFPTLTIDKPISQQEFDKKKAEFDKQVEQYQKDMEAQSKAHTDDVTDPPAATTPAASK
jgi:hypothetical protein